MALKYNLQRGSVDVDKAGTDVAVVYFEIIDASLPGTLGVRKEDSIEFTLNAGDWPLSKANLKTKAEAAIAARYPGATAE